VPVFVGRDRSRVRRPRAELLITAVVEKRLGALPACAHFLRRLDVAGIIDELCPVRDVAHLTHGQVVEALIANRLSSPMPLFKVARWAQQWAVEDVFGIHADFLNDDRIARALDAIAPHLDELVGSIGAKAITEFGIDASRCHWDMTSVSLYGAYENPDTGYPMVKFGHPKDRRTDLKQIQAGLAVTGDGGIPVTHRAFSGGAAEVSQVTGAMTALRQIAQRPDLLLVGDSKLLTYDNVSAMDAEGVHFLAPAAAASVDHAVYAALDLESAATVEYTAERDADKPAGQRAVYRVLEDEFTWTGRRKKDPALSMRRILVHSSSNATGQAKARNKKLARAREDLEKIQRNLGTRHYPDAKKVADTVAVIATKRRVTAYLHTDIGTGPDGKPTLTWHLDQEAIDAEAAVDGWYALLTNLPADQATPAQVLLHYKGQGAVERRYSHVKGPFAIAPMFLQSNRRIAALITVICLALLVYCLIERQVRQALGDQRTMRGLHPGSNQAARPTGELILTALSDLRMRSGTATNPPVVLVSEGIQARLLDILDIDPTRPRWLDTRFPMCERHS
jgi:transposase